MAKNIVKTIDIKTETNFSSDWLDDNHLVGVSSKECTVCSNEVDAFDPQYVNEGPSAHDHRMEFIGKRHIGHEVHRDKILQWSGITSSGYSGRTYQLTYCWKFRDNFVTEDDFNPVATASTVLFSIIDPDIPSDHFGSISNLTKLRAYNGDTPKQTTMSFGHVSSIYSRDERYTTHWFSTDSFVNEIVVDTTYSARGKDHLDRFGEARQQHEDVYSGQYNFMPDSIYMGDNLELYDLMVSVGLEPVEETMQASISQYPHRFNAIHEINGEANLTFDTKGAKPNSRLAVNSQRDWAVRNGFFQIKKQGRHVYPVVVGTEYLSKFDAKVTKIKWDKYLNNIPLYKKVSTLGPSGTAGTECVIGGQAQDHPDDNPLEKDGMDFDGTVDGAQKCTLSVYRPFTEGIGHRIDDSIGLIKTSDYFTTLEANMPEDSIEGQTPLEVYQELYNKFTTQHNLAKLNSYEPPRTGYEDVLQEDLIFISDVKDYSELSRGAILANNLGCHSSVMYGWARWWYGEDVWNQFKDNWDPDSQFEAFSDFRMVHWEKHVSIPSIQGYNLESILDADGNVVRTGSASDYGTPVVISEGYKIVDLNILSAKCPCSGLMIPIFFFGEKEAADWLLMSKKYPEVDSLNSYLIDSFTRRKDKCGYVGNKNANTLNHLFRLSSDYKNRQESLANNDITHAQPLFKMSKEYSLADLWFPLEKESLVRFGPLNGETVLDPDGNPVNRGDGESVRVPGNTIPNGVFSSWENKSEVTSPTWWNEVEQSLPNFSGTSSNAYVTDENNNPIWKCYWPARPTPFYDGFGNIVSRPSTQANYYSGYIQPSEKANPVHIEHHSGTHFPDRRDARANNIVHQGESLVFGLPGEFPHNSPVRDMFSSRWKQGIGFNLGTFHSSDFQAADVNRGAIQINIYKPNRKGNQVDSFEDGLKLDFEGWHAIGGGSSHSELLLDDGELDEFSMVSNSWDIGKDSGIELGCVKTIPVYNQHPRITSYNLKPTEPSVTIDFSNQQTALETYMYHASIDPETELAQGDIAKGYSNLEVAFGGRGWYVYTSMEKQSLPPNEQSDYIAPCEVEEFKQFPHPGIYSTQRNTFDPFGAPMLPTLLNITSPDLYDTIENKATGVTRVKTLIDQNNPPLGVNPAATHYAKQTNEFNGQACNPWLRLPHNTIFPSKDHLEDWPRTLYCNSTSKFYRILFNSSRPWQSTFYHSDYAGRINVRGYGFFQNGFRANSGMLLANQVHRPHAQEYSQHINLIGYAELPLYKGDHYGLQGSILYDSSYCDGGNHEILEGSMLSSYSVDSRLQKEVRGAGDVRNIIIQNPATLELLKTASYHEYGQSDPLHNWDGTEYTMFWGAMTPAISIRSTYIQPIYD